MRQISLREGDFPCQNCTREFPASKLDREMWCPDCRGIVVRKATTAARIVAAAVAIGLMIYVFAILETTTNFLMAYLLVIGFAYFLTYKITQRVAFVVIRSRGVSPQESASHG